jgi:UPF0271 protein
MCPGTFDINCDMGEGFGNWRMGDDAAVMPLISTANLACGFHAGDPVIMMNSVALAKECGVAVGAHPGLPDLLGFGRRMMGVSPNDLHAYVVYQIGALKGFLTAAGITLNHVKPHGALFHLLRDRTLADAALDAITTSAPGAAIYWAGPAGREPFAALAMERGVRVCTEAYPDLDYTDDGSLMVEREKRLVKPTLVYDRMIEIIKEKSLTNKSGTKIPMNVESVCIHGDSPNSSEVIAAARKAVADCGLKVGCAAFARRQNV